MLKDRNLRLILSNSGQISIPEKHGWENRHDVDANCLIQHVTVEVQVHGYNNKEIVTMMMMASTNSCVYFSVTYLIKFYINL